MRNRIETSTRIIVSFILISIALLGCRNQPIQSVIATQTLIPTATATPPGEFVPAPSSIVSNMPSNCIEILPGQYTWNAAQSIGDPSTIYDFGLYGVGYPNGE